MSILTGQIVERDAITHTAKVEASMGTLRCVTNQQVEVGQKILLAVRPSGIQVGRSAPAEGENSFGGDIQALTFVGDFLECQIKAGQDTLRVMLDPYEEFKIGERVYLNVPQARLAIVASL